MKLLQAYTFVKSDRERFFPHKKGKLDERFSIIRHK